jgi:hypothetical protein
VIVHEFGHVLGLGDDRDDAGNAVPGRDGTMMVGGARGVNPNTKLRIDTNLVDRIGNQLGNLGKVTCGWEGTITGFGKNRIAGSAARSPRATAVTSRSSSGPVAKRPSPVTS